jgi:hypothetical protein
VGARRERSPRLGPSAQGRALLAKAEETTFPDEATTYLSKAAALISKWELDEALVWADTPESERSTPITRTVEVTAPYANRKTVLLGVVAQANGCRVIRMQTSSEGHRVAVVGFAHDIEVTELLFSSLLVQMTRAMLVDESRQRSASATASWRRSFIVAFSNRVGQRLQAARRRAGVDHDQASPAGESTAAIVLADRSHRVDEETRRQFPRLRSSYVTSGGSASGARAGVRAGNQAELGGRLKPAPKTLSR